MTSLSWDTNLLLGRVIMTILWMLCQDRYGWRDGAGTEEARRDLLERLRTNLKNEGGD